MSEYQSKRYYWFKLKDSLLTSEKVDFLMRQKEGANYVVLYQCLCLKLINSAGKFAVLLGENTYVPYTIEKIKGETKDWFSFDTIRVALELYKQLGLVYEDENGMLNITDFEKLIGSETHRSEQMRLAKRERKNREKFSPDIRD